MEYIDIVDEENNLTGKSAPKDEFALHGYWHRIIIAWIVNEKNEILFEKRAKEKKYYANKWAILGGHISTGETPEQGLIREIKEELGIDLDKYSIKLINIHKSQKNIGEGKFNRYIYEYICITNVRKEEYILQEEEVSDVKYLSLEQIKKIREDEELLKEYTSDIKTIERIENYLV